jgi:hypothetical protein
MTIPYRRRRAVRTPVLADLTDVYRHLKLTPNMDGSPSDIGADLQRKLDAATSFIVGYITDRQPDDPAWTAEVESWTSLTAPPEVVAAILTFVAHLDAFRGDNTETLVNNESGFLPPEVRLLLNRYHDPSIA